MNSLIKKDINRFFTYNSQYNKYMDELDSYEYFSYKNMNVHIYYRKYKDNLDINHIKRVIKRVFVISQFIPYDLNIYLLLSPFKKTFNLEDYRKPLKTINCNSAFTYLNKPIIYILRFEEYPKVLMHELIHHITQIHSNFSSYNENRLKTHFKINNPSLDPNEAIVEFWATIMHLYQISIEYNLDFYKLFLKELQYSLYKSSQILTIQKESPNGIYTDETNTYAYIIFKTIFMYNLLEFQKIYTFPYNDTVLTDFLIKHSSLPLSSLSSIKNKKSLRFMIHSNY
jgi:hypothetical protein